MLTNTVAWLSLQIMSVHIMGMHSSVQDMSIALAVCLFCFPGKRCKDTPPCRGRGCVRPFPEHAPIGPCRPGMGPSKLHPCRSGCSLNLLPAVLPAWHWHIRMLASTTMNHLIACFMPHAANIGGASERYNLLGWTSHAGLLSSLPGRLLPDP